MTKFFQKIQKALFLAHFWSIHPIFDGKRQFLWKIQLCYTQLHMAFQRHAKIQKKLKIEFQGNVWAEGRTEGQTGRRKDGRTLFYRTIPTTTQGLIKVINAKNEKANIGKANLQLSQMQPLQTVLVKSFSKPKINNRYLATQLKVYIINKDTKMNSLKALSKNFARIYVLINNGTFQHLKLTCFQKICEWLLLVVTKVSFTAKENIEKNIREVYRS